MPVSRPGLGPTGGDSGRLPRE